MENVAIEILSYTDEHQPWFEKFNRDWIERYFWMEPIDFEVLQHPDKHIIDKGGNIFMAQVGKEMAGTVALKFVESGVYEFTKMAVDERFRGKHVGKALSIAAIEKARLLDADKIILYSNTILEPAIALYRKLGFVEVPVDGPYKRSNIKMELKLHHNDNGMSIRKAAMHDAPIIRALGIKTFHDTFAPFNKETDMQMYLEKSFAPGTVEKEIAETDTTFLVACDNSITVGYAKLRLSGKPDGLECDKPIEIERIYVVQEYLGKQVGHLLMSECLALARHLGRDVVWLGVWERNSRAIAFYKKWGFEIFGSHPFILGTDIQTDLLMRKKLIWRREENR